MTKKWMRLFGAVLGLLLFGAGVQGQERVILGDECFEEYLPLLENQRVALFTNQSGIVGDAVKEGAFPELGEGLTPLKKDAEGNDLVLGEHILDALLSRGVDVRAVFSPEHGFRGGADAGASVATGVDEKTGIPIYSLYGEKEYPSPEEMDSFDVLVADIQDVGLRYYTYYITLYHLLDVCSQDGKPVVLLDRPNPNGFYVDGPILEEKYISNVGLLPVPVVHGLTLGELSRMILGEGWLPGGRQADLTVIPCKNYTHQIKSSLLLPPSPNLKDMRAVYLYASTCFFENTAMSLGRGTSFPFEVYGCPAFSALPEYDFIFTPESIPGALYPPLLGETCYGRDLRDIPLEEIWEEGIDLSYLVDAYTSYVKIGGANFFPDLGGGRYWLDLLSGTDRVRTMIEEGYSAEEIEASWQGDVEAFLEQRRPYLLYEE